MSERTCDSDLLGRPREPPTGTYSLESQGVCKDDPDSDGRVVERLSVELWEAKYDGCEGDPEHSSYYYWVRELAGVGRSSCKSIRVDGRVLKLGKQTRILSASVEGQTGTNWGMPSMAKGELL